MKYKSKIKKKPNMKLAIQLNITYQTLFILENPKHFQKYHS